MLDRVEEERVRGRQREKGRGREFIGERGERRRWERQWLGRWLGGEGKEMIGGEEKNK